MSFFKKEYFHFKQVLCFDISFHLKNCQHKREISPVWSSIPNQKQNQRIKKDEITNAILPLGQAIMNQIRINGWKKIQQNDNKKMDERCVCMWRRFSVKKNLYQNVLHDKTVDLWLSPFIS